MFAYILGGNVLLKDFMEMGKMGERVWSVVD